MIYNIEFYENGSIKSLSISGFWLNFRGKFSYNKEDGFRDEREFKK